MQDHQIEQVEKGWRCPICLEEWKREPTGYARMYCPGIPYYKKWELIPDHLKTKTQLRGMRLRPIGAVRAKVRGRDGYYDLYDQNETKPMRQASEKQKAALAAGRELAGTTICPVCKERVDSRMIAKHGICWACDDRMRQEELESIITEARNGAVKWAGEMLQSGGLILDTETTGLDAPEIVQIAVIDLTGQPLLNTLVRPTVPIPADATAIHHITDYMVKDAPSWPEVFQRLAAITEGRTVITYNADFDYDAVSHTCRVTCVDFAKPTKKWECAMRAYARWYGEYSDYFGDFKWQRLWGGDHSALGDCLATLERIRMMAKVES